MKKHLLTIIIFSVFCSNQYAQLQYDTPNISDGSVICKTTTTITKTVNGKITEKSIEQTTFNTALKLAFSFNSQDLPKYDFVKYPNHRLPHIANGENYTRTYNETETFGAKVPRFPCNITYSQKIWGADPCDHANENAVLLTNISGKGQVEDSYRGVSVSISSIKDEKGYFFVKVFAGGGLGLIPDLKLDANVLKPDPDNDYKCKFFPSDNYFYKLRGPLTTAIFLNGTDLPETYKKLGAAYFKRFEPEREGSNETVTEYNLLKIDTTQIFSFIRNKLPYKTMNLQGSYRQVTTNKSTNEITETIENCDVVLIFGKFINDLLLTTENEEDYHNWLPVSKKSSDYKTLKVKATLNSEDDNPKDSIHFYLNNVSRNPGVCTNYPKKEKGVNPDVSADMWFPKEQSDPNIEQIDSFHVRTINMVKEATVDVEYNDFAAYGIISANAVIKNIKALSKYNNEFGLALPEDEDKNKIADKWEKDVGIFDKSLPPNDDSDEFPKFKEKIEKGDNGDGWSLFEEYRGFYSEKDFCKKPDNIQRKDQFIRTDPNFKDAFVFDETKTVFETYFAPTNAAELNWHILGNEHAILHPSNTIKFSLNAFGEFTDELSKTLDNYKHRWMNYNTPEDYRLKKKYCLFLMYSDHIGGTGSAGQSCFSPTGLSDKTTPIDRCELIAYQKKDAFNKAIHSMSPSYSMCSNYPKCPFKILTPSRMQRCPKCGEKIRFEKVLSYEQEEKLVEIMYLVTTIHEIGHGLGIDHHKKGVGRYTDTAGVDHPVTVATSIGLTDKKFIEGFDNALCACGVTDCAMRYVFMDLKEFRTGQILNERQTMYCRKNQFYLDHYGNKQQSDNCFETINPK